MSDDNFELATPDLRDITLGEVNRMILRFRQDVKEDIQNLAESIRNLSVVSSKQYESDKTEIKRRLSIVEGHQTWLMRMIVGSVLSQVLTIAGLLIAYSMGAL